MGDSDTLYACHDVSFGSGDASCAAWHYVPRVDHLAGSAGSPCIVMAHGFGGTRNAGLEPYAQTFATAGFHVLLFDYRHFGASGGEPRQLIHIRRQLTDWHAAIAHARTLSGVDGNRIGLWGTSFSGGHVVVVAAEDDSVAAISAQAPMLDGFATLQSLVRHAGLSAVAQASLAAMRDQAAAISGASPVMLPIVGAKGEVAGMSTEDALAGYKAITPVDWDNRFCARVMLAVPTYRPIRMVPKLKCPSLFIACSKDLITPPAPVRRAAGIAGDRSHIVELDMGHFDVYRGEGFTASSSSQLDFFCEALAVAKH